MSEPASRPPTPSVVEGLYEGTVYDGQAQSELLRLMQGDEIKVLDVGCGAGENARWLAAQGKEVHGITLSTDEAMLAAHHMAAVHVVDVQCWEPPYEDRTFDAVLLSHLVEHLSDPWGTIRKLAPLLKSGGRLYFGLPNVAHWRIRFRLLFGRFEYETMGPMDRTHLRFFTYHSAQGLLRDSGLEVQKVVAHGHLPVGPIRRLAPPVFRWVDRLCTALFPNFFGYEIYLVGKKPG